MNRRTVRLRLTGATICWFLIGIAGFRTETFLRLPNWVGVFGLLCAACTASLIFFPKFTLAFRYGGALAVGTLVLLGASVLAGSIRSDIDYGWFSVGETALTVMFGFTYAWWWLSDVKDWHRAHRLIGREHDPR